MRGLSRSGFPRQPSGGHAARATFRLLFALTRDVEFVTEASGKNLRGPAAVAFVQAEVLLAPPHRLGTREGNRCQRGPQQLGIVGVGTGHRNAQWHTAAIGHDRSLDAQFTAIGGVFTGFFATQRCLGHGPVQCLPTPSDAASRVVRFAGTFFRSDGIPEVEPIPGSTDARCWARRIAAATPSTGNPWRNR